jgi:hypothetical protein
MVSKVATFSVREFTVEFVPAIAMSVLVLKMIDFLRYAAKRDINGVVTQAITWIAGVCVLLLVAQTAWADGIQVGNRALSRLGFWRVPGERHLEELGQPQLLGHPHPDDPRTRSRGGSRPDRNRPGRGGLSP